MEKELEDYLLSVENYLKSMPTSERIDVVKELKSYMEELHTNDKLDAKEIINRLGSSKELAAGYLGEKISNNNSFNGKKFLMMFSFYSLTSLSGMVVLPCGTILAGAFIFAGIVSPLAGIIKLLGFFLGYDIPFVVLQIGGFTLNPMLAFPVTILVGIGFLLAGKGMWKLVIAYIHKVSAINRNINTIND